ncbi:hypothetical protein [Desulfobacter latus]|uniref:Uncharacterized protein n=1 Tax=Desulfobacter latus TaxID=2292 RepID=A0A850TGQ7_9BACT|nr:hypothetical protein [Desulfobacter latus]NWH06726.1 hypothetical protein [Desulfobacter latus]
MKAFASLRLSKPLTFALAYETMNESSEDKILIFFRSLGFPGIRKGEKNDEVCRYLEENGYKFTPDLVAGPHNIREAGIPMVRTNLGANSTVVYQFLVLRRIFYQDRVQI